MPSSTARIAWAAFLFASYLFGHLVFLLGSWLDEFYDWARHHTLNTQIALLLRLAALSCPHLFTRHRAPPKTPLACGWDSGRSKPATLCRR